MVGVGVGVGRQEKNVGKCRGGVCQQTRDIMLITASAAIDHRMPVIPSCPLIVNGGGFGLQKKMWVNTGRGGAKTQEM